MDLTDPKYVFMVADTAHWSLVGTDPIRFVNDWYPRIADVHLKDVIVKYSPPSPDGKAQRQARKYTPGTTFINSLVPAALTLPVSSAS